DVLVAETPTISPTPGQLVRYQDINCSIIQSTATIPALGSQVDFYVRATTADSYSIVTTGGTLTAAPARTIDVGPGPLAQTDVYGPDRVNFRTCTPIFADFYDQYGNPVTLSNGRSLDAGTQDFGDIFDNAACAGNPVDQIYVPSGSSSTIVYYRGEHLGDDSVGVGASDVYPGSVSFEVLLFMGDTRIPLSDLPIAKEVAMRADGSVLYAQTTTGMIYRSTDNGATWLAQCTTNAIVPLDYVGNLFVSTAGDATAYVTDQYTNYARIDQLDGGACPSIRQPFTQYIYGYWQSSAITVDPLGQLWAWNGNQLYYSGNQGTDWTFQYTNPAVNTQYTAHMSHHPTDTNIKLADFYYASSGTGLYQSLNGGTSFTATSAVGFGEPTYLARFDPAHTGYAYKLGRQSVDNGATWTANTGYNGLSVSWALDSSGAAYRFTGNGTTTVVERAPDARTPVWAALADGTLSEPFNTYVSQMAVSTDGSTIAVQSGGHLYLTTDAGANFEAITTPGTLAERSPGLVITSPTDAYAASGGDPVLIYATSDGGENWQRMGLFAGYGTQPYFHVNPNFPQTVYMRGEAFGGTDDGNVFATQDGFNTINYDPAGSVETWWGTGAVSLHDPLVFYTLGNG
ncbi:MAG TPA: hypothetical protein VLC93_18175, partial [Myxococcota bacterium]|nr:hypothetical protein [Myxococcota bacterium]